jgi:hypothetical protein
MLNNNKHLNKITIGSDPEVFGYSSVLKEFIPLCDLLGGSKEEPMKVTDNICIQEDNVAAEFTIPPTNSKNQFIAYIKEGLNVINNKLNPIDLEVNIAASANFNPYYLLSEKAVKFGCEPDINVYTGKENVVKCDDPTLRSCGGHIHIGLTDYFAELGVVEELEFKQTLVKAMDLFLGVPSVLLDQDVKRRQLYGKAGAYRLKPYGVEYRTLSNFWLTDDNYMGYVFEQSLRAVEFVTNNREVFDNNKLLQQIQDAINNNNSTLAASLMDSFEITLPKVYTNV